ncbi:glutathione S-transferase [Parathielavia hyrcaniae]|uniref:Glutathione S-transferase n=1 Tax=Parathielavia hyrcaniae TaxID=113614 RepID=A0AAN6Q5M9_9PEZI|nr:glutathione S-transferase [Parathielavia hyrcaniae]
MAQIDTSLLPHPTGAAARFAASHSSEHPPLKLYGGWFCPFVQRAWIVLAEKNVPHQYVEINPYKKEKHFLDLNPRGLVPTLSIELGSSSTTATATAGGNTKEKQRALYESTVICEYLDEAYADEARYGPRLLPAGDGDEEVVYQRARSRLWMNHVVTRVVPGFYRLLQHTPEKGYSIEEAREVFLKGLREFAQEMLDSPGSGRGGPWFLGERFGLVDVMLAPWAKRLFLIDHYKPGGVGIPKKGERGGDEEVWARWDRWFDAVVERESVKATWSEEDKYIEAYKRYAEDTTQSEVGQATRKGLSLP